MPTWIQLVFLACGVCFILALKGLSGPKTARNGNLIGAFGMSLPTETVGSEVTGTIQENLLAGPV